MASPTISPDASGIRKASSELGEVFAQNNCATPPRIKVISTDALINMPIPIAAGDGTFSPNFSANKVRRMPTTIPIAQPTRQPGGNALSPLVSSSAKPAHLTPIGEDRPAGPMPNLSRKIVYTRAGAQEPTGGAFSYAIVRLRGVEQINC